MEERGLADVDEDAKTVPIVGLVPDDGGCCAQTSTKDRSDYGRDWAMAKEVRVKGED